VLGILSHSIVTLTLIVSCRGDAPQPGPQQALVVRWGAATPTTHASDGVATGDLASVTLDHDVRPVVGPVHSFRMLASATLDVDALGRVPLGLEPAAAAIAGRRAALEPMYRDEEGWHDLPPRAVDVVLDESGRPTVVLEIAERAGERLQLYARAHGPLPDPVERVVLPAVDVPPGARLELGFGVLRLAGDGARVEYEVEACTPPPGAEEPAHDRGEPADAGGCVQLVRAEADSGEQRGWIDLRLSLEEVAGRRISLRLTTRQPDEPASLRALPTWTEASVWAPAPAGARRRNVVLVSLDTLRADHLPSYGYPVETAPFLEEAFAQRGTLFEQLVAAASSTAGSHMSIFSGLDVLQHQVVNMFRVLPTTHATLAERLRTAGYQTGAVT